MKTKYIVCLVFFYCFVNCYGQFKIKPVIDLSGEFSAFGTYYKKDVSSNVKYKESTDYGFIGYGLSVGGEYNLKNMSFLLLLHYQHTVSGLFIDIEKDKIKKSSTLGLNFKFDFLENHIIHPIVQVKYSTEVGSNYKNKYLNAFGPTNFQEQDVIKSYYFMYNTWIHSSNKSGSTPEINKNIYLSTPIIGELLVGFSIKVVEGLKINISSGYQLNVLKYKRVEHKFTNEVVDYNLILRNAPIRHVLIHSWSFQLGLSYAFDIHKKQSKTTTP